jgi:molybdopterin/thiamine biosynthesis adenylyltransferase
VPQVTIIVDPSEISACNLVYTYLYENKYFDTAIILQDSMFLNQPLPLTDLEKTEVMFLWHFTNHRVHWSSIKEPITDYNKAHNIFTHDDLILDAIHSYSTKSEFVKYCDMVYHQKHLWVGAFGFCSIIQTNFLEKLESVTDILNILINMNNNRQRRASESIFSLACNFTLGRNLTNSFDGLYYDGIGYNNNNVGTYFSKISFGR